MSTIQFVLSTGASSGMGAIFRGLLPQRIRDFLPVARKRRRVIDTWEEMGNESIEEMLLGISKTLATKLSNNVGVMQVEFYSKGSPQSLQGLASETPGLSSKNGSSEHVEN